MSNLFIFIPCMRVYNKTLILGVMMKYVMAICILLVLLVGCEPSGNTAPSHPQKPTTVDNKSVQLPIADDSSLLKTKIDSLEKELASCQASNINLQNRLDHYAPTYGPDMREPMSGDSGSYNLRGDRPSTQNPSNYIVWQVSSFDAGYANTTYAGNPSNGCSMTATITNNHPTFALTKVTINGDSVASPGTTVTIRPGESFTFVKKLSVPTIVDYQVTLNWTWQ
jgi:hypothetical protein